MFFLSSRTNHPFFRSLFSRAVWDEPMRALAPKYTSLRPRLKVGQGFNPDIKQSYDEGF